LQQLPAARILRRGDDRPSTRMIYRERTLRQDAAAIRRLRMPAASESDALVNTSIAEDEMDAADVATAVETPARNWLLALFFKLYAAHRARQWATIERVIRSGIAHIE
jgi:hypothetical protein